MENKLQVFKNEEFGEIRTLEIDGEPYFVGKDVASILGYKEPRSAVSKKVDEEDRGVTNCDTLGGKQKITIINESGLYNLLAKSQTPSVAYKTELKNWLVSLGLIQDKLLLTERKEIKFLDKLQEALKPFDLEGIKQYKVLNYRIDFYIPKLNIAIEYDENEHKDYSYKQQQGRQKEIENSLGCDFIRINDEQSDEYNIGFVLLHISNKL